ncbi:MAG: hypothetical protein WA364_28805 [Candidatus Nitrosopolaris sp.]
MVCVTLFICTSSLLVIIVLLEGSEYVEFEEVLEDVEFDEDLPLVGFDASPLGGVAAVIFEQVVRSIILDESKLTATTKPQSHKKTDELL